MTLTLALVVAAVSLGSIHTLAPDHWLPFAALARAEGWSARRTALVTGACGLGHVTASVALGLLGVLFGLGLLQAFGQRLESVSGLLLVGFGVAYGTWGLHRSISGHVHSHAHARGHVHAHTHPHSIQCGAPPQHATRSHCSAHAYQEQDVADECALPPHATRSHCSARAYQEQDVAAADRAPDHGRIHRPMTAWTLFLLFSADPCVAVIPLMFASAPLGWPSTLAVVAAYELATIVTMVVLVIPARAAAGLLRWAWADRWGDALAGGVVALVGAVVMTLGI
jgi:nickel/cobalt transporter (NicO) family protein